MRLSIESSARPGPDADPRVHVARTLSFLNLIDLAGSESARVCLSFHACVGSLHCVSFSKAPDSWPNCAQVVAFGSTDTAQLHN